jgi:transcription elongation regulator 1
MNFGMNAQAQPVATAAYAGFAATAQATQASSDSDKGRPVSSTAVSGSPWCVVWTTDGKVFFFNPSTRTSVWDRPPELYNRPDVDALVAKKPANGFGSEKRPLSRDSATAGDEHGEDSDDSMPIKKSRKEKKQERQMEELRKEKERKIEQKQKPKIEKIEDPAIKAELAAQEQRAKVFIFWFILTAVLFRSHLKSASRSSARCCKRRRSVRVQRGKRN